MRFRDMMREIETGKAFSLKWVTCSISKGTGGEIRFEDNMRLQVKEQEARMKGGTAAKPAQYTYENSRQYLNLYNEADGKHLRIYKRLIIEFNGKEIHY